MPLDNDTPLDLMIQNLVDGVCRAVDSSGGVPRLSAGGTRPLNPC